MYSACEMLARWNRFTRLHNAGDFILKPDGFEINIDDEIVLPEGWEDDFCFYPCTFWLHGYSPGTLQMIN